MSVFATKDGIENIFLRFDKNPARYQAGECLSGKIIVECGLTTPVKGIKLHLFGRMNIYWKKVEGGATNEFAEIEDYIDESLTVWVPHPRKKEEHWMYPGVHEYPFTYDLPTDIPETLEDSRYATLTYTVKSTVYMTMGRTSSSLDETIHVQALPDPSVPIPADEDLPKENCAYATISGGCFGKTHIELYMKLEKNVFKLGDTIKVHVECSVKGGRADVDKVLVLLVQESIYVCNMGAKEEARRKERLVFDIAEDNEDADSGECEKYDLELKIDESLPLSTFPWCDFINMGYFIHAVARTHSVFDDVVVKLPIVIGPKDLSEANTDKNQEEVVITEKENEEEKNDEDQVDKNSDKESEEGSEHDSGNEEDEDDNTDKDDE